jgi:hypothetical protein
MEEWERIKRRYEKIEQRNEGLASPYGSRAADRKEIINGGGDSHDDGTAVEYHCVVDENELLATSAVSSRSTAGDEFMEWSRRTRPYWSRLKDGWVTAKDWS